ncbi:hypothetical protein ABZZ80_25360 [Streptomyces sp. NPDC006356]
MTSPLSPRVYVMTVALLVGLVSSGACLGFVLDGWVGAVVGAAAAGLIYLADHIDDGRLPNP